MSGLIVFDFDNTLVHSKIDFAGIRRELFELLRASGHPDAAGDELADRLTRLSIGEIIDVGAAHDPAIHDEGWRMVLEYETAGMVAATVEPDARSTLHGLRDLGFQLAVMTNNARAATLAALELFDLRGGVRPGADPRRGADEARPGRHRQGDDDVRRGGRADGDGGRLVAGRGGRGTAPRCRSSGSGRARASWTSAAWRTGRSWSSSASWCRC